MTESNVQRVRFQPSSQLSYPHPWSEGSLVLECFTTIPSNYLPLLLKTLKVMLTINLLIFPLTQAWDTSSRASDNILGLWSLSLTFKVKGRQTLLGLLRINTHTVFFSNFWTFKQKRHLVVIPFKTWSFGLALHRTILSSPLQGLTECNGYFCIFAESRADLKDALDVTHWKMMSYLYQWI